MYTLRYRDDPTHLIFLIAPAEQGLSNMHLDEDTSQAPDIDFLIILHPEQDLRGPIEAALNVCIRPFGSEAGGAKINDFDGAPMRMKEKLLRHVELRE